MIISLPLSSTMNITNKWSISVVGSLVIQGQEIVSGFNYARTHFGLQAIYDVPSGKPGRMIPGVFIGSGLFKLVHTVNNEPEIPITSKEQLNALHPTPTPPYSHDQMQQILQAVASLNLAQSNLPKSTNITPIADLLAKAIASSTIGSVTPTPEPVLTNQSNEIVITLTNTPAKSTIDTSKDLVSNPSTITPPTNLDQSSSPQIPTPTQNTNKSDNPLDVSSLGSNDSLNIPDGSSLSDDFSTSLSSSLKSLTVHKNKSFSNKFILPATLTELELPNCTAFTDDFVHHSLHLLKHLKKLVLSDAYLLTDHCLRSLPSSLKMLDLSCANITDAGAGLFPSSLTYLSLSLNKKLTDKSIPLLPRSLIHLDLRCNDNLTDQSICGLPENLTFLSLFANQKLTDACIPHLPKTLTRLDWQYNPHLTDQCIPHLPPKLTYIDMRNNKLWTNAAIKGLPRTVTYLDLNWNTNLTDECIPYLPPDLVWFEAVSNRKFTDAGVSKLPQSLTHLELATTTQLTKHVASKLPKKLKHLSLSKNTTFDDSSIRDLPGSLTHLDLQSNTTLSSQFSEYLPATLMTLIVQSNKNVNDYTLKFLPVTLTKLDLRCSTLVTNEGARQLSRLVDLTWLDMNWNTTLKNDVLQFLPRKLTRLELSSNQNFSDEGVTFLPPPLQYLSLRLGVLFTDDSMKNFPRSLTQLNLDKNAKLTDLCIPYLPPSLTHLNLASNPHITRNGAMEMMKVCKGLKVLTLPYDKGANLTSSGLSSSSSPSR